jgi:SAM-dependent methyltransferase
VPRRPLSDVLRDNKEVALFATAIFVNAALLFTVEPMFSKMVLPLLGGTPAVWNTCMLFFQAALLGGYLYAYATSRWLPPRRQVPMHLALLGLSLLTIPIHVARGWTPPAGGPPVPWLILLLTVSLGAPFLLLSAGAPLLQRWFSYTEHHAAHNPYFLYAASNLGSLLALLAYPLLLEPNLRLTQQSTAWSIVYVLLILLIGVCAFSAVRTGSEERGPGNAGASVAPRSALAVLTRVRWVLLSLAPSSLLLGVTTYLTTDIAPVPLLWVVPLAIYLLTFVIAFSERQIIPREFMIGLQTVAALSLTVVLAIGAQRHVTSLAPIHLTAFFATALLCHSELARSRPKVDHLTEFYLWISVGGLLGGIFNVIVAPRVFATVVEYPIAVVLACLLRPRLGDESKPWSLSLDIVLPFVLGAVVVWVIQHGYETKLGEQGGAIAAGAFAVLCLGFLHRPLRFGLGVAAVLLGFAIGRGNDPTMLLTQRSFFGIYRVRGYPGYHSLQNGTTTHGGQSLRPTLMREPLTYYHRGGPVGQMFATLMTDKATRRVAIVGLGTGTVACYGRKGETWDYYEIDPVIVSIARNPRYFTYLRDCDPTIRVILGDARLSLRTAPDGAYDLIVLDAFNSDAIPAHLITREALALYLRKLAPGGAVAFHISNRYLRLQPVLSELARDARVAGVVGGDLNLSPAETAMNKFTSEWVVLSRRAEDLTALYQKPGWKMLAPRGAVRVWTDDFSDILSVFAW